MTTNHFFVVLDPTSEQQPALERAIQLASQYDASLVAFACQWLDSDDMGEYASRNEAKHTEQAKLTEWASRKLEPARQHKIDVTLELYWNKDWYQAVLDKAAQCSASLILKSTFPHSRGQRLLHQTSDYKLLRKAHCPVLLVHQGNQGGYCHLLAALDLSGDKAHEALNKHIMAAANWLCQGDPTNTLDVISVLDTGPIMPAEPGWVPVEPAAPELDKLAEELGVGKNRIHLPSGSPKTELADAVKTLNIDLLVIGSMARTGIAGALIGNTAERVLDAIPCDLLIVNRSQND